MTTDAAKGGHTPKMMLPDLINFAERSKQLCLTEKTILVGGILGWILNIVKIVEAVSDPVTDMFVLRCVGVVVAPLGAILGFL